MLPLRHQRSKGTRSKLTKPLRYHTTEVGPRRRSPHGVPVFHCLHRGIPMRCQNHFVPGLEFLEDRYCPSATAFAFVPTDQFQVVMEAREAANQTFPSDQVIPTEQVVPIYMRVFPPGQSNPNEIATDPSNARDGMKVEMAVLAFADGHLDGYDAAVIDAVASASVSSAGAWSWGEWSWGEFHWGV
jgi:hypothetical protein